MKVKNFLSLTAGDYNGDGKETLTVFASLDSGTALFSFETFFDETDKDVKNVKTGSVSLQSAKNLLHPLYIDNWDQFQINSNLLSEWINETSSNWGKLLNEIKGKGFKNCLSDKNGLNRLGASLISADIVSYTAGAIWLAT